MSGLVDSDHCCPPDVAACEDLMDLTSWKTTHIKIAGLELDQLNPRIPGIFNQRTTRDIVAALIEHEDVYALAKSIVEFGGLYPNERLIAVEENGGKIVVEGNRRLAALKLLHSPDLAPQNLVERFRNLSNKIDPHQIEKVEVVLAPSRATAARLIVARHTGDAVRRWSPAQQSRYIRTLVKPGNTIEDVAEEIKLSPGEIREFLRTDTMVQLAHVLPLDDSVRSALDDKDKFTVTTLQRLTQSAEGQSFLGITFDPDANAVGHYDVEEFKRAYGRIVSDITTGKIDTRKLNSSAHIKKYLKRINQAKPDTTKKGTWTSTSLLSGKTEAAKSAIKAATKPKPKPKEDPFLIPRGFHCALKSPRIREIFGELRRLKLRDYPNACAVLARIFIELVIGSYLDNTGKIQPLLDKAKKGKKGDDWAPTLRHMMGVVLQDRDVQLKPQTRKALNRMVSNHESLLSLEHIDQFVHNRYVAPSERDLRIMWSAVEPLLEQFMEEPPAGTTTTGA
jgi:hypothetical protein